MNYNPKYTESERMSHLEKEKFLAKDVSQYEYEVNLASDDALSLYSLLKDYIDENEIKAELGLFNDTRKKALGVREYIQLKASEDVPAAVEAFDEVRDVYIVQVKITANGLEEKLTQLSYNINTNLDNEIKGKFSDVLKLYDNNSKGFNKAWNILNKYQSFKSNSEQQIWKVTDKMAAHKEALKELNDLENNVPEE